MKIAVIGSRTFDDKKLLDVILSGYEIDLIISGGARGADSLAQEYAKERNIPAKIFLPDWSIGRHAGFLRNTQIVEAADCVIAFWDGKSKGTLDSINKAKKLGKDCAIITF